MSRKFLKRIIAGCQLGPDPALVAHMTKLQLEYVVGHNVSLIIVLMYFLSPFHFLVVPYLGCF